MTILGIETATEHLSAALIAGGSKRFERYICSRSSHCELLTGFIIKLTEEAGIEPKNIEGISVSVGPGSFTGLRIGIATAMGLAYGIGVKTAPVNTLAALTGGAAVPGSLVCPLIDAKRSEAYTGIFRTTGGIPETVLEAAAVPVDKLGEMLLNTGETVTVTGPAVEIFKDRLSGCGADLIFLPPDEARPRALQVAELGLLIFREGGETHPASLKPVYLRRSDAEIVRDKKISSMKV